MSQFSSQASVNDEIVRGGTRFRFDGAKWKRIGQNFDTTAIAEEVAASIGGGGGGGGGTGAYHGHIYAPSEGTYYLDPRAPVGRTITEFYAICGTGGISADLYNSGAAVGSLNVTPAGATASLSNTSLAEGGTLEMVTSNYSACYDFRFAVRYTQ